MVILSFLLLPQTLIENVLEIQKKNTKMITPLDSITDVNYQL